MVDGNRIKAYASMKSFKKGDDDPDDFSGTRRSNQTHRSSTDPDARLMRKGPGQESTLCHLAAMTVHAVTGIVRSAPVGVVGKKSEVDLAPEMVEELPEGAVLAADTGFDSGKSTQGCRRLEVKPHPVRKSRGPSVDGRTTRHESYQTSMTVRPEGREGVWRGQVRGADASGPAARLAQSGPCL